MILKSFKNFIPKFRLFNLSTKNRASRKNCLIMKEYETERTEFNKKFKDTRKNIQKNYWEAQSKIENEWLENYVKEITDKKYRDDARQRNSIITNAFVCYESIKKEIDYQQNFRAKQKQWKQEDMEILVQKHNMLTLLDEQSKHWITFDNMDQKIEENINLLIPPSILSSKDYYRRLQKQAILYDQGQYDEAEDVRMNKEVIDYKNKILINIYRDLKNLIRKVTFTEEHTIYDQYKDYVTRVKNSLGANSPKAKLIIAKLENNYRKILTYSRLENEKPLNKFLEIEKQAQSLLSILVAWSQYTEIIYLPDDQIEILSGKESMTSAEMNETKQGILKKAGENVKEEIKDYGLEKLKELMKIRRINEGEVYQELKEEDLSDNDEDIKMCNKKENEQINEQSSDFDSSKTSEGEKEKQMDEEDQEVEDLNKITNNEELSKFKSKLFADLGLKKDEIDEINKSFEINEEKLDENKETSELRDPMSNQIIDQIGNTEINDIFRSEAFENIIKSSKDLFDFKKPKVHFEVDLYNDSLTRFFELARFVDESKKDQISIIMNYYIKELQDINNNHLSTEYIQKKKTLLHLLKLASHYKITDAQNLKKVFDLYKYDKIGFKFD